jgi:hypothetical protein
MVDVPIMSNLISNAKATLVGAARLEITPPLNVGILMSSVEERWAPFEGVQSPLLARAMVMRDAAEQGANAIAIVALDLLGLSGTAVGGWHAFKARISESSGQVVHPDRIVLACSHTHSGPESAALSDLYKTPQHKAWISVLIERIGKAIAEAALTARPCRLEHGATTAPGWGIFRRIRTTQGILLSHPPPPDDIVLSRDGPVDDSVNLLVAREVREGQVVAMLVNATCHPVHEMCIPRVSADFPGILSAALEEAHPGCVAQFLNGAAGNINPTTVSAGPDASRRHGMALAAAIQRLLASGTMSESTNQRISLARGAVALPSRSSTGRVEGDSLHAEVVGLRVGPMAFAFLPGEPFVETALRLREQSPFDTTAVVGYAESYIGYVPTDAAFIEGGYETTFGRWSVLAPGSEPALCQAAIALLNDLHAGVEGDQVRPPGRDMPPPTTEGGSHA